MTIRELLAVLHAAPPRPPVARRRLTKSSSKPHRGVLLLPPEGWPKPAPKGSRNPNWRARYKDPETRRTRVVTLTQKEARSAATRLAFAIDLHAKIKARREAIMVASRKL